ncbi:hypothetical protein SH668x_002349 [Planctomicrobium sp. SH668]|uniref:hypothetical protein n=1 Tax=Planctomicrobium sp. SH668 TaxID=3448126 RepID=UPI003F5AE185
MAGPKVSIDPAPGRKAKGDWFPHPPDEVLLGFRYTDVVLNDQLTKVALLVMILPYLDAIFMQAFPRERTESFLEGHGELSTSWLRQRHPERIPPEMPHWRVKHLPGRWGGHISKPRFHTP